MWLTFLVVIYLWNWLSRWIVSMFDQPGTQNIVNKCPVLFLCMMMLPVPCPMSPSSLSPLFLFYPLPIIVTIIFVLPITHHCHHYFVLPITHHCHHYLSFGCILLMYYMFVLKRYCTIVQIDLNIVHVFRIH